MKILFTGASSFTGMWFAENLSKNGHEVTCTFQRSVEDYSGLRKERIEKIKPHCRMVFNCTFGEEAFFRLIEKEKWDALCHHAADVTDYKSLSFDVLQAVKRNTLRLRKILNTLQVKQVILTGSLFEPREGKGDEPLEAFSPYGLSKGITADIFTFECAKANIPLKKFVIPNPFGPYEEARFTSYLMKEWAAGKTPTVNTPDYIRDNIPISLLAKAYVQFVEKAPLNAFEKFNPSGYVESQGDFTKRFSEAMQKHLQIPCPFTLAKQTEFTEPLKRINTENLKKELNWCEEEAWKDLAAYYKNAFLKEPITV